MRFVAVKNCSDELRLMDINGLNTDRTVSSSLCALTRLEVSPFSLGKDTLYGCGRRSPDLVDGQPVVLMIDEANQVAHLAASLTP